MGAGTEYIYIHPSLRSRSNLRFQEVNILETGLRPDEIDTRISRPGSKEIDFTFKASPRLLTLNSNFFFFFCKFANRLERCSTIPFDQRPRGKGMEGNEEERNDVGL